MKFEISERITTFHSEAEVLELAVAQFKKVAAVAYLKSDVITAKKIEATFGSINRSDTTSVSVRRTEDGVIIVAATHYRPSILFWILFVALLFSYIGWIIPLGLYLSQRSNVRQAVQDCLRRVKDETTRMARIDAQVERPSAMDELSKLAELKERGHITEEEFSAKKAQLLRAQ